jgi:FkbM family methyltransferase
VHAFEPTPSTFQLLSLNTADYPNITTMPLAVWDHDTQVELRDFGVTTSMFNSVLNERHADQQGTTITVAACTLDAYVEQATLTPTFIKIDAEAAESQVIAGADQILRSARPSLTVEVGDNEHDRPVPSRDLLRTVCSTYSYAPFEFAEGRIRPHSIRDHYAYDNILLVPC